MLTCQTTQDLDLSTTAEIHLYKSILKIRSIAPTLPKHVQATVEAPRKPQTPTSANVQARLFNSSPVKAAMTDAVNSIRIALGIKEAKACIRKRLRAKDYATGQEAKSASATQTTKANEASTAAMLAAEDWDGLSASGSEQKKHSMQDSDGEGIDYDLYASRLAGSSDGDSDRGPSKAEKLIYENISKGRSKSTSMKDDSLPEGEDVEERSVGQELTQEISVEEDSSEEPSFISKPKNPEKAPSSAPPKSTTFLPSLSLGGYWSGSESDRDDDASTAEPQQRKNRRGQQARRLIWEKKYGKHAKHLKNPKQDQKRDRDEGWDPRRGAKEPDDRGKRGRGRGRGRIRAEAGRGRGKGIGAAASTGANSAPVVARKVKSAATTPLHPSWEAARKAKEQKKPVAFQGKKVVFD